MKKLLLLVLLSFSNTSFGFDSYPAFSLLGEDYKGDPSTNTEIKNMPPILSQDGLNICYGFAAVTLYQQFQCRELKTDCSKIPASQTPSPLYMASLGADAKSKRGASEDPDEIPTSPAGNSERSLVGFANGGGGYADSCYPFDQFVANHKNSMSETNKAFENLRATINKSKTEGGVCADCLVKQLNDDFGLRTDNQAVLKAVASGSFEKFLFDIFLKNCQTMAPMTPGFQVHTWPNETADYKPPTYKQMMSKMQEILSSKRAFSVGLCLDEKKPLDGSCKKPHDTVISGYQMFCKPDHTCREALKITNSWGQDWQDENHGGWVDAQTFFEYVDKGPKNLTWLTK